MKVIFLDVDGVINNNYYYLESDKEEDQCYQFLSKRLIENLKRIVDETGAKLVLSSSWRSSLDDNLKPRSVMGQYLVEALSKDGLFLYDKTEVLGINRYEEIKTWIKNHPQTTRYVVLDDSDYSWKDLSVNWIRPDANTGISESNVIESIKILNQ